MERACRSFFMRFHIRDTHVKKTETIGLYDELSTDCRNGHKLHDIVAFVVNAAARTPADSRWKGL